MKTLISIIALEFFAVTSVLSMPDARVNAVDVTQVYGVDKEKCTVDYICYDRVAHAYSNILDLVAEGLEDVFPSAVTDYMSKNLCAMLEKLSSAHGLSYPESSITTLTTGESMKNCFNEFQFGVGDWAVVLFSGKWLEQEQIYRAALQKQKVLIPFPYVVTSFYPQNGDYDNGRYTRRSKQLEIVMIYENGDWFIDDIIYANGKSLRRTLQSMLATAR